MATWKQLVYMVLDELKLTSDDALFNEEHVTFLLGKYRALVLKTKLEQEKYTELSDSNYQTLCLDLEQVSAIAGEVCEGGTYLRSTSKVPNTLESSSLNVYTEDYFQSVITVVPKERMKYVGNNKWLKNIIYAALGPDNYLYLKSMNPQFLYLEKIKVTGIFENPEDVADLLCCNDSSSTCDILDTDFPIDDAYIPSVLELVIKDLSSKPYLPEDKENDADDTLAGIGNKTSR